MQKEKRFIFLEGPSGQVHDQTGMMRLAVDFCKDIFSAEQTEGLILGQSF